MTDAKRNTNPDTVGEERDFKNDVGGWWFDWTNDPDPQTFWDRRREGFLAHNKRCAEKDRLKVLQRAVWHKEKMLFGGSNHDV